MKWPEVKEFDIESATILAGYMGSHAHGTFVPANQDGIDDHDIMGIYVPPKNYIIGLHEKDHTVQWQGDYDLTFYEIRKFFGLLLKNNPNVLGLLWLEHNLYVKKTTQGQQLIDNRAIFSSKQAYKSFTGYAYGQLKRMEHYKFEGYMGEKRKELVNKFGYDCKNAAHLIRLLRMGIEFLSTGELNVMRPDRSQLVDIKQGKYSLDQIKTMADDLFKKAELALINSSLPSQPDFNKAEEILMNIIEETRFSQK